MKKICLILIFLFCIPVVHADKIVLDTPETIQTPEASKLDWEVVSINADRKYMKIKYRWRTSEDETIFTQRNADHYWICRDSYEDTNPVFNEECTDAGVPDACCTGVGEGTCDHLVQTDSCFTDVFSFQIRSQDVGTPIGVGLRQLIWNQMKQDILTEGNDGTFE